MISPPCAIKPFITLWKKLSLNVKLSLFFPFAIAKKFKAVLGTYSKSVTDNILSEGKEASMEIHENDELFDTNVPEIFGIASIVSVVKNVSYYNKKK